MRSMLSFVSTLSIAALSGACTIPTSQSTEETTSDLTGDPADACTSKTPGLGHAGWHASQGVAELDQYGKLHLALSVSDAGIRDWFPWYDGSSEKVFACVPMRPGPYGGGPTYRRVDLAWAETFTHRGGLFDAHRTSLPVDDEHAYTTWTFKDGVYFGLETHAGIIWAQHPGEDRLVVLIGSASPTLRPVPR